MINIWLLILWAIAAIVICAASYFMLYRSARASRMAMAADTDRAEKELLEDFDNVNWGELEQTTPGKELLQLIQHEHPQLPLQVRMNALQSQSPEISHALAMLALYVYEDMKLSDEKVAKIIGALREDRRSVRVFLPPQQGVTVEDQKKIARELFHVLAEREGVAS